MNHKKYKSIKTQMLVALLLLIVFLTIGMMASTGIILSNKYTKEINNNNATVTRLLSNNLESFMDKAYSITDELAQNDTIISMDGVQQARILKECADRYDFIELLFVQDSTGMQTARSSGECADRSDRWWFPYVNDEGMSFITKSYISASTGQPVSSIFIPIKKGNTIVGSIGMDISLTHIQQLIEENSDAESGRYSFVMDGDSVVVAHPNSEYVTQLYNMEKETKQVDEQEESIVVAEGYKKMLAAAKNNEAGTLAFSDDGVASYGAYESVQMAGESDDWYIITVQDEATAKSIIKDIISSVSLVAIVLMILSGILILVFANTIAKPIKEISVLLSKAASGDFTTQYHTKSKTEIGLLTDSFNEMMVNVSKLVASTRDIAGNINNSVEELNTISIVATEVASNIKDSAGEILTGTTDQAKDAEKSAELNSMLNEQFIALSDKTEAMVEKASNATEVTVQGAQKVTILREKNHSTYAMIEKTAEAIEGLNKESETIGTILNTLDDISSQTNLLSLNASIEAARAGEHGKSFAVVAEEIQKLSVASNNSTADIAQIIEKIQEQIASSVSMMEDIKKVSGEQNDAVQDVNEAFDQIRITTDSITEFIDQIVAFVQEMQENNDKVVMSITNIAAITEETVACTETVTTSIRNQTEEIAGIADHAADLKEKALLLEREIGKFRVM